MFNKNKNQKEESKKSEEENENPEGVAQESLNSLKENNILITLQTSKDSINKHNGPNIVSKLASLLFVANKEKKLEIVYRTNKNPHMQTIYRNK